MLSLHSLRWGLALVIASSALACGSGGGSASSGDGGTLGDDGGGGVMIGPDGGVITGEGGGGGGADGGGGGGDEGGSTGGHDGGGGGSSGGDSGTTAVRTVGSFMGLNGFIDDPTTLLAAVGNVREYHDWQWCEGNGDPSYPPYPNDLNSYSLFGGSWNFDTYYSTLQGDGVTTSPVIQNGIPWLNGGAVPPVSAGASTTAPASYVAHADMLFQYAARYGSTKVPTSELKVASGQVVATGLGTLHSIEDWNEEDAWWINSDGSPLFSPDDYAAMASADYDGDQGRLGKTFGIKNADPTMKMVMGGQSGKGDGSAWVTSITSYLDGIRAWAATHRAGSFPADVLNVHHYSFGTSNAGISPEDDQIEATMKQIVAYRDTNLPGKEVWITEFGYDTDPTSPLHVPAIGSSSAEIVQGQWIVRTYLALLAAGMDEAYLFVSRDSCSTPPCSTQFATSGVLTTTETPKPSFYFLTAFRSRLATMSWTGEPASGNASVMIATFQDPTGKGAYVVWAPTSDGTTVPAYSLDVGKATTATSVALADQQMTGVASPLTVTGGHVSVAVSETPTIILVDAM